MGGLLSLPLKPPITTLPVDPHQFSDALFYKLRSHCLPFSLLSFLNFPSSPPGSSIGGHDESPGDHAATDAADPPAAGAFPPAAPGLAPAAAGCNAAAGTVTTF